MSRGLEDLSRLVKMLDIGLGPRPRPSRRVGDKCELIGEQMWDLSRQPPGLTPPVAPVPPDFELGAASVEGVAGVGEAGVAGVGVGSGAGLDLGPAEPDSPPPPPPPVVGALFDSPAPPVGFRVGAAAPAVSVELAGASSCPPELVVPEMPVFVLEPAFLALASAVRLARLFSTWSAESMKLCQMSAGKVPPSTGEPLKSVVIGTRLSG